MRLFTVESSGTVRVTTKLKVERECAHCEKKTFNRKYCSRVCFRANESLLRDLRLCHKMVREV